MTDYSTLLPYCITEAQREKIKALIKHGTQRAAAEALGCAKSSITQVINACRKRKELNSPDVLPTDIVRKISALTDSDGETKLKWVKYDRELSHRLELFKQAVEALKEDIPKEPPIAKPRIAFKHLCTQYIITDYHLGMYAWGEETGADWDTNIAETLLIKWFQYATGMAPKSEVGVLVLLGDFLHWDGLDSVTPTSGHVLDADTRIRHLVRIAIRVTRKCVRMLLKQHRKVHVIITEGNHDMLGSTWLSEVIDVHYENEPRVTVDKSPAPYYSYRFGNNLFCYHHGHLKKLSELDRVFAALFKEDWGECKHVYGHTGHYHYNKVIETPLMQIEQHRTLASPDAYAARGGWISGRDAKVITYHREHGKVSELVISPDMVNAPSEPSK